MDEKIPNVLFAAFLSLAFTSGKADDAKPGQENKQILNEQKPVVSLKGGDPAPTFKVSKWLQGKEVKAFELGKVYVVEFWATWCGPCIAFMPHLAELQAQYKTQGVTIIGYSAVDANNSEEQVAAFVKKRGPKLDYTFAYGDDRTIYDAWMGAAGRNGIPCTFVVDKVGRIAYIGHPMFLCMVLPQVVAGTPARVISEEIARIYAEYSKDISGTAPKDPKAALQALKTFEAMYPLLADFSPSLRLKLSYLPKYGRPDEAKEYAAGLVAKAVIKNDPDLLRQISSFLRFGDGKENKELLAVAVKAAEAEVQMAGEKDAEALINLAETYFASGDKAEAKVCAQRAVVAAAGESPALKQFIEKQARVIADG